MSNSAEAFNKIRKQLAGLQADQIKTLGERIDHAERAHADEIRALESRLQDVKSELSRARAERSMARPIEKLWNHGDGRRLIEDAFAHDPARTQIALNYLGGSLIAGELRDQSLAAEQSALPFV